jgi:hypothetical protein
LRSIIATKVSSLSRTRSLSDMRAPDDGFHYHLRRRRCISLGSQATMTGWYQASDFMAQDTTMHRGWPAPDSRGVGTRRVHCRLLMPFSKLRGQLSSNLLEFIEALPAISS